MWKREEGNGSLGTNTVMMDEWLGVVRDEVEAGTVSPHSLVLLFNAASDAEHAGDVATLEQTLELARAIAELAGESLQAEAVRLATICEQSLASVRERQRPAAASKPQEQTGAATEPGGAEASTCPECGNEVAPGAVRCRRCGHRFI
jgi:hypothetical protein